MANTFLTNYSVAVNWCNNAIIRCNEIPEIDPSVYENMMSALIVGYVDGQVQCPNCQEAIKIHPVVDEDGYETSLWECEQCGTTWDPDYFDGVDCNDLEIFQWFLTDCSEGDVEFLRKHFGLLFTYSDKLDLYVLCVTHYGTSWDYVEWETDLPQAKRGLGEKK